MPDIVFDRAAQTVFDETYRASLDPRVAALLDLDPTDLTTRMTKAAGLAAEGLIIDVPIQVWGWDAYVTMNLRKIDGFTWVPSALQPSVGYSIHVESGPGADNPPYIPYDPTKPPAGSIRVSTDPADFPPFAAPAPAPPAPSTDLVGAVAFGNVYKAGPGVIISGNSCNVFDGEPVTQAGATYKAKVTKSPFGIVVMWERQA